jgi:DNA-directed RNA polymerase specialized sigma24 family protein
MNVNLSQLKVAQLRVEQAEERLAQLRRHRDALVAAAVEDGFSIRTIATAMGLRKSRVHEIAAGKEA